MDIPERGSRRSSARSSESPTSASGERFGLGSGSSSRRGDSSSRTRAPSTAADGSAASGQEASKESRVNWKKFVTLNPPNLVKLGIVEAD